MNPEWHTITAARHKGQAQTQHGSLEKWSLDLVDSRGAQLADVYSQNKRADVVPNMKVFGTVEQGQYGPRLKTAQTEDGSPTWQQPNGSGPPSPSSDLGQPDTTDLPPSPQTASQGVSAPPQRQATTNHLDARERRITRLHSQEMSIRVLTASGFLKEVQDFATARDAIKQWADWFDNDGLST